MGYLRFAINTADEQSFRRIINLPKRGIGTTSVEKMVVAAFEHDIPLWEVLTNIQTFTWQGCQCGRAIRNIG